MKPQAAAVAVVLLLLAFAALAGEVGPYDAPHIPGPVGAWTVNNDGAGSGLDADLLDGKSSAIFCEVAGGAACNMAAGTLAPGANPTLDFASNSIASITLNANTTFATASLAAGRALTLRIIGDGSTRTLNFPAWKFVGASAPVSLAANKIAILSLVSFSTTDASVVASYAAEP